MAVRTGLRPRLACVAAITLVAIGLTGCVATSTTPTAAAPAPEDTQGAEASPPVTTLSVSCQPTDQDRYVYNPDRLIVVTACIRVTGTVEAIRLEADGDLHILLALDPAFEGVLQPSNQGEELGDLVIEPVCIRQVTQGDAIATCLADHDPLAGPMPAAGQRVWMEGRYVLDSEHGSWAELHPLYRWGPIDGPAASIAPGKPGPTQAPVSTGSRGFYTPPGWDGHSDVDCADFDTHAQAQSFFIGTGGSKTYDPYRLDGDHDGLACESLP